MPPDLKDRLRDPAVIFWSLEQAALRAAGRADGHRALESELYV